MARQTIDEGAIVVGLLTPGPITRLVESAYGRLLFGRRTLQDLPDDEKGQGPAIILQATNVQTGAMWRFRRKYMGDYRIGLIRKPKVSLARAVAASSAFPPFLSPVDLPVRPADFDTTTAGECFAPPFNEHVILSDGGVYDNMGLEQVWKRARTVFVSDAGMKLGAEPEPKRDWARHAKRTLDLIDSQVRALRTRQVISSYLTCRRQGAYWSTRLTFDAVNKASSRTPISDDLGIAQVDPRPLAGVPTRLARMDEGTQEKLINWGYAVCDASLRKFYSTWEGVTRPQGLPYPNRGW